MRVIVFGATGQIGRRVVADLIACGHDVTAYVRNPDKVDARDPRLAIVVGELSETTRILDAVRGADAAIRALGPETRGPRKPRQSPLTSITASVQGRTAAADLS